MNTTTLESPSATIPASVLPAEQEVNNLRAQLVLAEEKATHERAEADRAAKEARHQKVLDLIAGLGVDTVREAIMILRREGGSKPQSVAKRAFPRALSKETLDQMKAMLAAGATSRSVSEALKVGLSTVDARKAKWGMTKSRVEAVTPKARHKGGYHIPPARRAKIKAALQSDTPISTISRRFRVSRQSCYSIKHELQAA